MQPARAPRSSLVERTFWLSLLLSFVLLGAWAVASPHMASPDEPAHAAKAAATVRGQLAADETGFRPGRGTFTVPALFAQAWAQPCFAYEPDVTGGCSAPIQGDVDTLVEVESHVARYNPVYYALVGLPSLLPLSELTFTAMRLVSVLINSILIALTFRVVAGLRRPLFPMLGVFAALTPAMLFIGASVTPQGPEVFGAVLVGATLMALVFDPRIEARPARAWILVAGTAAFVLARGLSPGYLFLIVVFVLLAAPRFAPIREVLADRRVRLPIVLCAALSVGGLVYTLASGSLALGIVFPDPGLTAAGVVGRMLAQTGSYLEQVLGVFGWGDVHLPLPLLVVLGGIVLTVGLLGFASAGWRGRGVLALVLAATIAVPIAVQLLSFRESGIVWQGRYVLPLAVQAPLLAGFLIWAHRLAERLGSSILKTSVAVLALCQVAAIIVNLHRYVNGAGGPWLGTVDEPWQPIVPAAVIVGVTIAAWIAVVLLASRFAARTDDSGQISDPEPRTSGSSAG